MCFETAQAGLVFLKHAQKLYGGKKQLQEFFHTYVDEMRSLGFDPSRVRVEVDPALGAFMRTMGRYFWTPRLPATLFNWLATGATFGLAPLVTAFSEVAGGRAKPGVFSPYLGHIMMSTGHTGLLPAEAVLAHEIGHHLAHKSKEINELLRPLPQEMAATWLALEATPPGRRRPVRAGLKLALATYLGGLAAVRWSRALGAERLQPAGKPDPDVLFNLSFVPLDKMRPGQRRELYRTLLALERLRGDLPGPSLPLGKYLGVLREGPLYRLAGQLLYRVERRLRIDPGTLKIMVKSRSAEDLRKAG